MSEEVMAWKTNHGSFHETKEAADKAEVVENRSHRYREAEKAVTRQLVEHGFEDKGYAVGPSRWFISGGWDYGEGAFVRCVISDDKVRGEADYSMDVPLAEFLLEWKHSE